MLRYLFLLSSIVFFNVLIAQDYTTYTIKDLGTIKIPNSMELQAGSYKKYIESKYNSLNIEVNGDRIVFQQKGLNEFSDNSFNTYCRIIIETVYGEYGRLNTGYGVVSSADIEELNNLYKNQLVQLFRGTNMKLEKFYGCSIFKVNSQPCIKISYLRSMNNNPPVKVDLYSFENRDRMHTLTVSYRLQDEKLWKSKLAHTVNSFKITNIR